MNERLLKLYVDVLWNFQISKALTKMKNVLVGKKLYSMKSESLFQIYSLNFIPTPLPGKRYCTSKALNNTFKLLWLFYPVHGAQTMGGVFHYINTFRVIEDYTVLPRTTCKCISWLIIQFWRRFVYILISENHLRSKFPWPAYFNWQFIFILTALKLDLRILYK